MCIWVDNNAYKEGVDKNQLFDYLYNIAISISIKNKFLEGGNEVAIFILL